MTDDAAYHRRLRELQARWNEIERATRTSRLRGRWSDLRVVETHSLRRGVVLHDIGRGMLLVGTRAPTPIQQIVMDRAATDLPWFRDPLRADVMAALRAP